MIDDETRIAILVEAHRLIEQASHQAVENIRRGAHLSYPPGEHTKEAGLTSAEVQDLVALNLSPGCSSALQKIITNAMGEFLFNWLCVVDGVGDPRGWTGSTWLGVDLSLPDKERDRPMLHDDSFESYWRLREPAR